MFKNKLDDVLKQVNVVFMAADHYDVEFDGMWVQIINPTHPLYFWPIQLYSATNPLWSNTWSNHSSNIFASQNIPE